MGHSFRKPNKPVAEARPVDPLWLEIETNRREHRKLQAEKEKEDSDKRRVCMDTLIIKLKEHILQTSEDGKYFCLVQFDEKRDAVFFDGICVMQDAKITLQKGSNIVLHPYVAERIQAAFDENYFEIDWIKKCWMRIDVKEKSAVVALV